MEFSKMTSSIMKVVNSKIEEKEKFSLVKELVKEYYNAGFNSGIASLMEEKIEEYKDRIKKLPETGRESRRKTSGKKLKSLATADDQARAQHHSATSNAPALNGIACPKCGAGLLDSYPMTILASNPPQKQIHCPDCDYVGTRIC